MLLVFVLRHEEDLTSQSRILGACARRAAIQQELSLSNQVAPDEEFKKLGAASPEQVEVILNELRERFPRDPRTSYFATLAALDRKAVSEAEGYLKNGLAEQEILKAFFSNGMLESEMRTLLAQLLLQRGADGEARDLFRPACAIIKDGTPDGLNPEWVASVCRR